MKRLLLILLLLPSLAWAQKPPINGVAGPTTSSQLHGIMTDASGTGGLLLFTTGDGSHLTGVSNSPVSVTWYGAKGDGTTDDTAAFSAAMTAACAKTGPAIQVPQSTGSYKITSTLPMCGGLSLECNDGATIHYTGSGALFTIGASQSPRMRGCILQGNHLANTYGIQIAGMVSTAAVKGVFERLAIINFGDVATASGAGIQIDTDSQAVTIANSTFSNNGAGIATTAPTDTLDIHDNLITSPAGSTGPCVSLGGASGATTMQLRHNSLSCNGPAVTVNAGTGVVYLTDNEQENQSGVSLTGAHSTAYDIVAAGGIIAVNNTCNVHANNSYCWYVADGISNSRFSGNTVNGTNTAGFRVGSGTANIYEYTRTDGSIAINYSASTYPGMVSATSAGSTSVYSIGWQSPVGGFSVAMPGVAYDAGDVGQATILDSANTNRKFAFGYDGTREVGYVQVIKSGTAAEPLLLNPKGGGVSVYAPVFPGLTGICSANNTSAVTCAAAVPLVPLTAPSAPASGWLLYTDVSDGKLKAIASNGAVATLGTP